MLLRRSDQRGFADHGWLRSFHTFSFADYYDPANMGFRALRVINEDRVQPGKGFPTHPHRDMEIITYVLEGALEHKDSMGTGSVIRPGDVQRMSAGTGVTHSEFNASKSDPVHFLQIWIVPDRRNYPPGYEQKTFNTEERTGKLRLIASNDGRQGSVSVHQDLNLYATLLSPETRLEHAVLPGRNLFLHVAQGSAQISDVELNAGDALVVTDPETLKLSSKSSAELLLFDLG
jgi:redox-sensitive bicupin YhaK (pirin superfamily)